MHDPTCVYVSDVNTFDVNQAASHVDSEVLLRAKVQYDKGEKDAYKKKSDVKKFKG